MKRSHKMKAMMLFEETQERRDEFHREQIDKHDNDDDFEKGVPLDASLTEQLAELIQARRNVAVAEIASAVAEERVESIREKFNKAVCKVHCANDQKREFSVVGEAGKATLHLLKPERQEARAMKDLREKLPDGMPEALKDMLVKKLMSGDVGLGANGVIELDADEPPKEKTPMRFH